MKLKYDKLLSTFAFNFNLRRYAKAAEVDTALAVAQLAVHAAEQEAAEAERTALRAA